MSVTGQWGTLSLAVPDELASTRDAINSFAQLLLTTLEIVNVALEFVKAFIKGLIDPIKAVVDAIVNEIKDLIKTLRGIGLYITGDWALMSWPFEDVRGGFSAYERRMIARMTDRSDPTRPDIPSTVKVMGLFTYQSVTAEEIYKLLHYITALLKMFGLSFFPDSSRLPIPTIRDTSYGSDFSSVFQFKQLTESVSSFDTPPRFCRVTWVTNPPSDKHPFNPFPAIGPSGYVVTVSTLEKGIPLRCARPQSSALKKDGSQPREYSKVFDTSSQEVVLHGGAEMLAFKGSAFEFNKNVSGSKPRDGATQVFGMPDNNTVIPLELLGSANALGVPGDGRGSEFLLQRAFLIESETALAQWFAGEYTTALSIDDMPLDAKFEFGSNGELRVVAGSERPVANYYVRVWSAGKEVAEGVAVPQWDFVSSAVAPEGSKSGQPFVVDMKSGISSLSYPSPARRIVFPTAYSKDYLHALETALLLLVLCRADYPLVEELRKADSVGDGLAKGVYAGTGFAVKASGLEGSRDLLRKMFSDLDKMSSPGVDPVQWRVNLFRKVRDTAFEIYDRTGPQPGLEKSIVDATEALRTIGWGQLKDLDGVPDTYEDECDRLGVSSQDPLLSLFDPDTNWAGMVEYGVAPSIHAMGLSPGAVESLFYVSEDTGGDVYRLRDDFAVWSPESLEVVFEEEDPVKVLALIDSAPPVLRSLYGQFVDGRGVLNVPEKWRVYFENLQNRSEGRTYSSGDDCPVFYAGLSDVRTFAEGGGGPDGFWQGVLNCRGMIRNYNDGQLLAEAALVLNSASGSYARPDEDGEWIALRLFNAMPELEGFFDNLEEWVTSISSAVEAASNLLIQYIEFIQASIVDLQQLIRRINGLIQSFLSVMVSVPQFSGLLLVSNGTDGLLSDFVSADNKPFDSPSHYGAGVAVVVAGAPAFLVDLLSVAVGNPDSDQMTGVTGSPDAIGIEQIEPGDSPSSEVPDVL